MARPRSELQKIFEDLLKSKQVYFQPPPNVQMKYPAIVYNRLFADTKFAGNVPYLYDKRYQVTYIDRNPDSLVPDKIAALPMCVFNRYFSSDGLNHDVFNIYF